MGKADWSCRSCLHDDISVVIMVFNGVTGAARQTFAPASTELGAPPRQPGCITSGQAAQYQAKFIAAFEGMRASQLRLVFDTLDADGYGTLNEQDVARLASHVFVGSTGSDGVGRICFATMDKAGAGSITFEEFSAYLASEEVDGDGTANAALEAKNVVLEREVERLRLEVAVLQHQQSTSQDTEETDV